MPRSSEKLSVFEQLMEWIGWLQIAASPFLIGLFLGAVSYFKFPGSLGIALGVGCVVIGIGVGAWLANRVKRKGSTITFLSHMIDSSTEDPVRGDTSKR
jgi:hypothetical protein